MFRNPYMYPHSSMHPQTTEYASTNTAFNTKLLVNIFAFVLFCFTDYYIALIHCNFKLPSSKKCYPCCNFFEAVRDSRLSMVDEQVDLIQLVQMAKFRGFNGLHWKQFPYGSCCTAEAQSSEGRVKYEVSICWSCRWFTLKCSAVQGREGNQ